MIRDTSNRNLHGYLESYLELPFERVAEHFRRREILKVLNILGCSRLAEVGCGLDSIFNHLDGNISGYVIEPIQKLLDMQNTLPPNVTKLHSRLEDVPMEDGIFSDTVLMSSILHEIDHPENFLQLALNLLSANGHIVCVVPNAWSLHRLVGWKKGILESPESRTTTQDVMQQRQTTFTPESITALFTRLNLRVVECRTFMPKLLSHSQMQNLLDNEIIDFKFIETLQELSSELDPVGSELIIIGQKK